MHSVGAGRAALAGTFPLAMGKRLLLTYLYSSLVDLFIYFYLPSPTTSLGENNSGGSLEVILFPIVAQVSHTVESLVLITPWRSHLPSGRQVLPCC